MADTSPGTRCKRVRFGVTDVFDVTQYVHGPTWWRLAGPPPRSVRVRSIILQKIFSNARRTRDYHRARCNFVRRNISFEDVIVLAMAVGAVEVDYEQQIPVPAPQL
jgi:hypothetical protein